jgi:signal transduction histidine kinase
MRGRFEPKSSGKHFLLSLFAVYVVVAILFTVILQTTQLFARQELQTINKRFEMRPWLSWSQESLTRLNPERLWQYHQAHEIPRQWWAWDYTLSWLIENNHPKAMNKFVIFNHLLEDEPPAEAIATFPWMKPLLHHPLPRTALAEAISFIAKSDARLIILDNDFPQYSEDDSALAKAIHDASSGKTSGKPVPVLTARTINRRQQANIIALEIPSAPSGLLHELQALEPSSQSPRDVMNKFTGITGILPDEDQVVRTLAVRIRGIDGRLHESIALRALSSLGQLPQGISEALPDAMDIDFSMPPNSELYPVRPMTYLLDPERKRALQSQNEHAGDVTLKNTIVVIGDGVTDVYSTPLTNTGLNQMSGAEILVHGIETIARGSWPTRLDGLSAIFYSTLISLAGGLIWIASKSVQYKVLGIAQDRKTPGILIMLIDMTCMLATLYGAFLVACLAFAYWSLIVPVFVTAISLGAASVASLLWERENKRQEALAAKLDAAEEKLILSRDKYESDLKRQEAEAKSREILLDRQRRQEFVRRINHDLNAPVTVLNWILSDLEHEGFDTPDAQEKIARMSKNSDKLCGLIDQLVQSYDYDTEPGAHDKSAVCDLTKIVSDCLDLQKPLAQMHSSQIEQELPDAPLLTEASSLEVSRVIDNLIRNAIKHNPPGTKVSVKLQTTGHHHIVDVIDNGQGIKPEHIEHIFEAGYRGQANGEPHAKDGQGLGLDIVKTLVERMGGQISTESKVGAGTRFSVVFPSSLHGAEEIHGSNGKKIKDNDKDEQD